MRKKLLWSGAALMILGALAVYLGSEYAVRNPQSWLGRCCVWLVHRGYSPLVAIGGRQARPAEAPNVVIQPGLKKALPDMLGWPKVPEPEVVEPIAVDPEFVVNPDAPRDVVRVPVVDLLPSFEPINPEPVTTPEGVVLPSVPELVAELTPSRMPYADEDDSPELQEARKEWLPFFEAEPQTPAGNEIEPSSQADPTDDPFHSGLQEDPNYHHQYPGCPYTGGCPYPRSVPAMAPRIVDLPIPKPTQPKPEPRPIPTEEEEDARPPMPQSRATPLPGTDTLECRPSDGPADYDLAEPF